MVYFDSKTARPKAYIDTMSFGYADCKNNKHGPRARTHLLTDK